MQKTEILRLIKNRRFLFLWIDQILTQTAFNLVNFSLLVLVYRMTGSNLAEAVLILTMIIPTALFSILAGLISDFYDRRKIMLFIDILWGISVFGFLFFNNSLILILVMTFIINTVNRFFTPAEQSALPSFVSDKELLLANSLFSITLNGAFIIGLSLAGPLMFIGGNSLPFLVAGILALIGAIFVYFLPTCLITTSKKNVIERLVSDTKMEVKKGYEFINGNKAIKMAIVTLTLFQVFMNMAITLGPGYAEKVLQIDVRHASFVFAVPAALGSLIGIYLMQRWQNKVLKREMVKRGILISFFGVLGLVLAPFLSDVGLELISGRRGFFIRPLSLILSLSGFTMLVAFLLGLAFSLIAIPVTTIISEQTPKILLGRIWGVANMFQFTVASVPLLFIGYLADKIGLLPLVLVFDLLILISYLYTELKVFDKIFEGKKNV